MHLMQLSEKLRILFLRLNLTQEQLGQELGIAQTTVGRWLAGKSRPYDRHALQLARILGVKVDVLVDDAKELPAELLEEPGAGIKAAVAEAAASFPDDSKAGQQSFEARVFRDQWKRSSLETAKALREKAAELNALAESLELPFLGSSLDRSNAAAREHAKKLHAAAKRTQEGSEDARRSGTG